MDCVTTIIGTEYRPKCSFLEPATTSLLHLPLRTPSGHHLATAWLPPVTSHQSMDRTRLRIACIRQVLQSQIPEAQYT